MNKHFAEHNFIAEFSSEKQLMKQYPGYLI